METIHKVEFLNWFFSGSDQEQKEILISLGQRVRDSLMENDESFINVETLMMESGDIYLEEKKTSDEFKLGKFKIIDFDLDIE